MDSAIEESKSSRSKKDETYYAIRSFGQGIVVKKWGDAVNAGFLQKAPYGNAVKFATKSDAEKWLEHKPFPMTANGVVKSWAQKQHPLVRLCFFSIMVTIFFIGGFYFATKLEDYLQCRSNVQLASTSVCVALKKVSMTITDQFNKLIDIIFYEIIGAILVFSSWSVGLL